MTRTQLQNIDVSRMGFGSDMRGKELNIPSLQPSGRRQQQRDCTATGAAEVESIRVVKDMSLKSFRANLIAHFDIAFRRNEVLWPGRRNRLQQINI
jgi:hypothetical protein